MPCTSEALRWSGQHPPGRTMAAGRRLLRSLHVGLVLDSEVVRCPSRITAAADTAVGAAALGVRLEDIRGGLRGGTTASSPVTPKVGRRRFASSGCGSEFGSEIRGAELYITSYSPTSGARRQQSGRAAPPLHLPFLWSSRRIPRRSAFISRSNRASACRDLTL